MASGSSSPLLSLGPLSPLPSPTSGQMGQAGRGGWSGAWRVLRAVWSGSPPLPMRSLVSYRWVSPRLLVVGQASKTRFWTEDTTVNRGAHGSERCHYRSHQYVPTSLDPNPLQRARELLADQNLQYSQSATRWRTSWPISPSLNSHLPWPTLLAL